MYDKGLLRAHIMWAEAARGPERYPYKDSAGILTIGYGRNLEEKGISPAEAAILLDNDMLDAQKDAATLPFWLSLSPVRKMVIVDMIFNLGLPKFLRFRRLNKALDEADWNLASHEMIDSKWYKQTQRRAVVLVEAMRTGRWKGTP